MRHIGLDVHQRDTKLCWIDDETGQVSGRSTVPTGEVVRVIRALPGERAVVMEAGSQSWFLARALLSLPQTQVTVVDAFKARRSLEGMHPGKKTDKWDALGLAKLSLENRAAAMAVWLADPQTHELRILSHVRLSLVQQAASMQTQIRALLRSEGLSCQGSALTGRKAQRDLDALTAVLSPSGAAGLAALRRSLQGLKKEIQTLEQQLLKLVMAHPACRRLMTIEGCGFVLAGLIVGEIGQISRFSQAKYLRSYAGLAPRISQSGDRCVTGPLSQGNRHLKYALVLLAQHFSWSKGFADTRLKRAYYRTLNQHGPKPAKVALARHLCDVIFAMLRDDTDFAPEALAA